MSTDNAPQSQLAVVGVLLVIISPVPACLPPNAKLRGAKRPCRERPSERSERFRASSYVSFDGRNTEILADFLSKDVFNLGMPGNGRAPVLRWIVPPRMTAALTKKLTAIVP